ncbi:MAG: type II secretion system protein [Lentisphaerae bacterium]|nr:type II secretion system protein [Lentisphaerota bacterium]
MKKRGFTLIEMLMVIVVIGILSGIVFKLFSMVTRKGQESETIRRLECIANALNEYFVEYGQYPPAVNMTYICENTGLQHPNFRDIFLPQNPDWKDNTLFDYTGLVAWLWPRDNPPNAAAWPRLPGYSIKHKENVQYIGDSARDQAAKERWARFLEEVPLSSGKQAILNNNVSDGYGTYPWPYTNDVLTVKDDYGGDLRYQCTPPYLTYRLWSLGPNGNDGDADDIHRDKWDL